MDINSFNESQKRHKPKQKCLKNASLAFIGGGTMSLIGNGIIDLLFNFANFDQQSASVLMVLIVIVLTIILTGLGVYDQLAQIFGAGLFIPISGFANSMSSEAIESRKEGPIFGIGSNMFKLAGSVITYGIVSACIVSLVRYLFSW